MDFVRSPLGAPVPRVLAWDASKDNEVGCEYIIMEKCQGEMLATCWNDSLSDPRLHHVHDVAKMQTELSAIRFSQYGSIYYKEDVDSALQSRPLYAEGVPEDNFSERFRIGPSVERRFYRGERAHMAIDRGPCQLLNSPFHGKSLTLVI